MSNQSYDNGNGCGGVIFSAVALGIVIGIAVMLNSVCTGVFD